MYVYSVVYKGNNVLCKSVFWYNDKSNVSPVGASRATSRGRARGGAVLVYINIFMIVID